MLDALMLSDGKDVCFETWKTLPSEALGEHRPSPSLVYLNLYVWSCSEPLRRGAHLHNAGGNSSSPNVDSQDIIMYSE